MNELENKNGVDEDMEENISLSSELEDEEDTSSCTEDEKEEKKILPERSSRGKRYNQLIGEEEEKDAKFWGHNTWEEEDEDSGWSSEDEKMELEMLGGEDSNTDSNEYSDDSNEEDIEESIQDEDEITDKSRKIKSTSRGKYKDPSLFLKSAQKELLRKKKVRKKNKKKKIHNIIEPRSMSVRDSTKQKKHDLQEIIKKRDEEAQNRAKRLNSRIKKSRNNSNSITQEERLKACVEIEKMNIESLNQLEAFEEHRRYLDNTSSIRKQLQSGPLSIYVSWSSYRLMESEKDKSDEILSKDEFCRELILYTDGCIPSIINQRRIVKDSDMKIDDDRNFKICSVFGTPAKYLDPLTNKYYSNLEAFKIIRREYHINAYKEFVRNLNEVDELIQYNRKLVYMKDNEKQAYNTL